MCSQFHSEALKQDVAEAEKRYKKTLDKHSKIYRADMRKKMKKLKTSDPKEYWKLLNKDRDRKQPTSLWETYVSFLGFSDILFQRFCSFYF
jgi:hypothetical protein